MVCFKLFSHSLVSFVMRSHVGLVVVLAALVYLITCATETDDPVRWPAAESKWTWNEHSVVPELTLAEKFDFFFLHIKDKVNDLCYAILSFYETK